MTPKPVLRPAAALNGCGPWPQRRPGEHQMPREALEQIGLARADPKMVQLHLRLRPGQGRGAVERGGIAVLVHGVNQGVAGAGHHRPERDARHGPGGDGHATAQGQNRVQHGADGVRQRGPVHGGRIAQGAAAAQKAGTVGFRPDVTRRALRHHQVAGPYLRFGGRPAPPCRQDGVSVGQPLGLHEHLGEDRVREVVGAADQRKLSVGGDVDGARSLAGIRHGDAADLGILFRRDKDLHHRRQRTVATGELGAVLPEGHLVLVRHHAKGLQPRRPNLPASGVPQKDPGPPVIERRVFSPTGDGQVPPPATAGARGRQHHGVAPVGQQVGDGFRFVRTGIMPATRRTNGLGGRRLDVHRQGARHRHIARRPLLQQQLRRLDDGFRMEPRPHHPVQHGIGDGHDRHPLMVRHERLHHCHGLPGWNPAGGVVQRLIEAVAAPAPGRTDPDEVADRGRGIDHGGQRGCVGRDHQVRIQAALQAQVGDTEVGILVGVLHVAHVVGRFRNAPGHVMLQAEADLAPHNQLAGVLQQAALRRAHHQRRHQVLEHRPRPGHQHGAARHGGDGTAEPEPFAGGDVILGDRHEAGQPCLGRQQVVAVGVQRPFIRQEADGQQLALRVAEEAELHRQRHAAGSLRDGEKPRRQGHGVGCRAGVVPAVAFDRPVQRRGPKHQVRAVRLGVQERRRQCCSRLRIRGEAGEDIVSCCLCKPGADRGERGAYLPQARRRRACSGQARHLLGRDGGDVGQPRVIGRHFGRVFLPALAGVGERDQVAGQVAAVHGRHIARLQRAQVGRIVPIVEMPAEARHPRHGGQCRFQPLDGVQQPGPPKIMRGRGRQQIEADIGGRGPARQHGRRVLLEVVGRQHVVGRRHEGFEEPPGPPGRHP